ncbi:MAG: hypothetical protein HOQ10_16475 [Frateuria sp.]|nr:hypothetical protein [Frateuria sp.]
MPTHPARPCAAFAPALALLAMRVLWLGAYPLDSDEPQHAHVAWSIAQGHVPYRDVFDNHGPLFALLYAPLMHALGERADILWWLRLAVVPWYGLAVFATWRVARSLYRPAVADAAVLLGALMQVFFLKTGQFRTDDAWAALWLGSLALALSRGRSAGHWLLAGLGVGAALSISQKTLPLLATALLAGGCVWMASPRRRVRPIVRRAVAFLAGCLVIPTGLGLWLASMHDLLPAWRDLVAYGLAPTGGASHAWRQAAYLGLLALVMAVAAYRLPRLATNEARWRAFLALHGALYALLIWVAWPLSTPQDFLPVIPTIMLVLTGAIASRLDADASSKGAGVLVATALVALELGVLVQRAPPWRDALAGERAELATVLRDTDPGDTVMDAKSGAIFRPRPYYPVMESLALRRLRYGRMADTIPGALVAHRTMVVIPDRLPPADRLFVARNYLLGPAGVYVAGKTLPAGSQPFAIAVPGQYTLSDGARPLAVGIDGNRPADQWNLAAGHHVLARAAGRTLVLSWSKAWNRGWRPAAH